MKDLVVFLFVAAFLGFWVLLIGGIGFWAVRRFNRKKDEWLAFGQTHGLQPQPRRWNFSNLIGQRGEFSLLLRADATQVGRSNDPNHLQINIRLYIPGLPETIVVYRENAVSKLGKLFHTQDIEIGDPAFDAEFKEKGKSPDAVRNHLLDRGRAQILREKMQGLIEEAILDEKGLRLHCSAHLDQPAELEAVAARVDALAALAAALS